MDIDGITKTSSGKPGFFKYVFNFNQDTKNYLLNLIQFSILVIIPIILLNLLIKRFNPEPDEDKNSLEIIFEIIIYVIAIFLGTYFIHKIVTFIPTYSGEKYAEIIGITNVIPVLYILISSQNTNINAKITILCNRIMDLWDGQGNNNNNNKKKKKKTSSSSSSSSSSSQQQNNSSTSLINNLPQMSQSLSQSLTPDYNQMYQQDSTPLIGAASPTNNSAMEQMYEPMAANSGGAFGSSW